MFLNCNFSLYSNWQKLKNMLLMKQCDCFQISMLLNNTCSLNISYIRQYILICPSSSSQVPYLYPHNLPNILSFFLVVVVVVANKPWVQSVLPYMHGCGAVHWSVSNLSWPLSPKKETLPSQQSPASNSSSDKAVARSPSPLTLEF